LTVAQLGSYCGLTFLAPEGTRLRRTSVQGKALNARITQMIVDGMKKQ
jgi:hypothetical protein